MTDLNPAIAKLLADFIGDEVDPADYINVLGDSLDCDDPSDLDLLIEHLTDYMSETNREQRKEVANLFMTTFEKVIYEFMTTWRPAIEYIHSKEMKEAS